ncbi:hypothetical protein [Nonomuraea typhae]|uniref:hypothetical protein n=1 Tax=Nonomuraea typhae TaxID=2603600 RepID=UPI0012FB8875|nr:hypothetical protein [Nonomuraea typhae]
MLRITASDAVAQGDDGVVLAYAWRVSPGQWVTGDRPHIIVSELEAIRYVTARWQATLTTLPRPPTTATATAPWF